MRLSETQIVAGLAHPNVFVRDVVLNYLEDCHRTQVDITSHAIESVERFGWEEAFLWPHRIAKFQLDAQTLPWALSQIEQTDDTGPNDNMRWHLAHMVAQAPVEVLRPQLDRIFSLDVFHSNRRFMPKSCDTDAELIGLRIELANQSPAECWKKLNDHCQKIAGVENFSDANIPYAELLIERIATDGASFASKVLEILEQPYDDQSDGADNWLTGMMICLAGQLRLEAAIDALYQKFEVDWDWYSEEALLALVHIGTPTVGKMVCQRYENALTHERIYSHGILEAVHYPTVVDDLLPLLAIEENADFRGRLGVVLASHFDEAGLEPALEVFEEFPNDPERQAIIQRLFALSSLAGLDHPLQGQWLERIETNWQQFVSMRNEFEPAIDELFSQSSDQLEDLALETEDYGEDPFFLDRVPDDAWRAEQRPIIRTAPRIGRNDLCPCGSGKKYKRCCLRAEKS